MTEEEFNTWFAETWAPAFKAMVMEGTDDYDVAKEGLEQLLTMLRPMIKAML